MTNENLNNGGITRWTQNIEDLYRNNFIFAKALKHLVETSNEALAGEYKAGGKKIYVCNGIVFLLEEWERWKKHIIN